MRRRSFGHRKAGFTRAHTRYGRRRRGRKVRAYHVGRGGVRL